MSLGCPKNLVDSEVMIGHLHREGHSLTTDCSEAEILIVNTCSFIAEARQESIDTILEAAEFKKSGACRRLVVTGCLAERYSKEIQSDLPEVDAVLGTNQIPLIARAVAGEPVPAPGRFGRSKADLYLYNHRTPRVPATPPYTAYIKIAEGCDHSCSFCIIPKLRGAFRSRRIDSVVREAEDLAARGVREITLVAQDTTSYGTDLGMQDGLTRLVEALERIDGICWIRFLYVYPKLVSDRLMHLVAGSEKICKYIDMPLQHASTRILRAMRRGGSRLSLSRMIERIRRGIPDVTFRTTMIVGFPGETERDFQELLGFCRDVEFDRLGVFVYSNEEGTRSFGMGGQVPIRTARRRQGELMEQQAAISRRKNSRLVGRELPILVEGASRESDLLLQGRLPSQAPEIDGVCLISDSEVGALKPGEFRTIRITRALAHDLIGTVVR
ncbi:MAG: 30S ribosomal protein S12 methylthiotransferase RimO [Acidobacteria bacterium]|nr:30S ribosomal protein S12 methylthiotransferase RimO [Acidobacteriota bacterium]